MEGLITLDTGFSAAISAVILALATAYLKNSQKNSESGIKDKVVEKNDEAIKLIVELTRRIDALENVVCKMGDGSIMVQHKVTESCDRVVYVLQEVKSSLVKIAKQDLTATKIQPTEIPKDSLGKVIIKE